MIKSFKPVVAAAALSLAMLSQMAVAAEEQFFPLIDYRVGPYGSNGQAFYGGFIDYLNYVNLKEKGVNGVQMTYEECETEYNNAKGVECYERLKSKAAKSSGPVHTMSTGISYALIDKSAQDKLPLAMMGYGRTDAVDGSVFPYAFPLVTTYQMQASAIVKFIKEKARRRPGRQEDRLSVSRLRLRQGSDHRHGSRGRAEQVHAGADSGRPPGQRAGRAMAEDSSGEAGFRRLLGLGRDEPDGAQGGAEGRLPA